MKTKLTVVLMVGVLTFVSAPLFGQDAAALYKTKCSVCHGDQGQGKPHLGAKLAGTTKTEAEIATLLTDGGGTKAPHVKPIAGLTPEQAKGLAAFVKSLK